MVKEERHRYIQFKIIGSIEKEITEQELLNAIWKSIWNLFGLKEANKIGLWLSHVDFETKLGIIRCSHKTKEIVITALTLIKEISGKRIILSPIKTSGTIRGIRNVMEIKSNNQNKL
jgi:ribonuclease P/MRP protein subunit POP5